MTDATTPGRWLTADDRPVAPLEIAATRKARRRGLLGRSGIQGALLLRPASSIHTFGMKFAIDVAFCDRALRVIQVRTLPPGRLTRPRPLASTVFEAEAGSLDAWGIIPGTQLGIGEPPPV